MKYRVVFVTIIVLLLVSASVAQIDAMSTAPPSQRAGQFGQSVSGTVVNADGKPVKDARVEVHSLSTGEIITAGYSLPSGNFSFNNVPPGQYEVRAVAGLQDATQRIDVDSFGINDIMLRVAAASGTGSGSATVSATELRVPEKARKEYEKAEEAFKKQKENEAREHCDKALKADPTYSRALSLSALLDVMGNKLDSARAKAEESVKSDPGYGMGYVVLGAIYNTLQRYDDAARTLNAALPLVPNAWQAHFELSRALLGKGEYHEALRESDRTLQGAPENYAPAHLLRAHVLLGLKAYTEAVAELEKCIGADPNGVNSEEARRTLGQVKSFMAVASK